MFHSLRHQSKSAIKNAQRRNIANMMNKQHTYDVTFFIGPHKEQFQANRIFLAAISDVFQAMLYGSMTESQPNSTAIIPDIDADAFKVVIDFAYCLEPPITIKNVVFITNICRKYQISSLSPICTEYFTSHLNQKTICSSLNNAVNLQLSDLISSCKNAIKERLGYYAKDIIKTNDFLQMGAPAMSVFLQIDQLRIKEEDLWDALLKWDSTQRSGVSVRAPKRRKLNNGGKSENSGGSDALKSICRFVRFGLMNEEYFVQKVQSTKCLTNEETLEISNYIMCKGNKVQCPSFSVTKRVFDNFIAVKRTEIRNRQIVKTQNPFHELIMERREAPHCFQKVCNEALRVETMSTARIAGITLVNFGGTLHISVSIRRLYDDIIRWGANRVPSLYYDVTLQDVKVSSSPIPIYFEEPLEMKMGKAYRMEVSVEKSPRGPNESPTYQIHRVRTNVTVDNLTVKCSTSRDIDGILGASYEVNGLISTMYFLKD